MKYDHVHPTIPRPSPSVSYITCPLLTSGPLLFNNILSLICTAHMCMHVGTSTGA